MTTAVQMIPRAKLAPSPFQPDRVSKRGNLDELAESFKDVGILEPLIVRAKPDPNGKTHELVAGHRRDLAAGIAGLDEVPCIVRDYSDEQVLEVFAIENGQREGLHPLDECAVFTELVKRGRSVADIADKTGRDRSYVAKRLKLVDLGKKTSAALDAGEINLGAALVLARVPGKLQDEALGDAVGGYQEPGTVVTEKLVKRIVEEQYMLRIDGKAFPIDDDQLVPKAGACSHCPKRTGNQVELFADAKSPDLCTDPACFKQKQKAYFPIRTKAHKDAGGEVLQGKAAKSALGYSSGYTTLDRERYVYGKWLKARAILKKAGAKPPITLVQDPDTGAAVELVKEADLKKAEAALAPKTKGGQAAVDYEAKDAAKRKRDKAKAKRQARVNAKAFEQAVASAEQADEVTVPNLRDDLIDLVVRAFIGRAWNDTQKALITRRGLEVIRRKAYYAGGTANPDNEGTLLKHYDSLPAAGRLAMGVELALHMSAPSVAAHGPAGDAKKWNAAMKALGVDLKAIEAEVKAEEKAAAVAKRKKASKKKGTKAKAAAKKKAPKKKAAGTKKKAPARKAKKKGGSK